MSLIILDELQVMDTAVEAVVSRVRAHDIHNDIRLIGLSRAAVACPNDVGLFLGIPRDSTHGIYNFGSVCDTTMTGVQVVGFTAQQYTTCMKMMSQAVWDTIQVHLQPTKYVCVVVPTQEEVILTSQVLKERVLNCRDQKIWQQSQEKEDERSACIQDATVQEMLEHGIGLLHPGMCKADCDIVQDLVSSRKIRVSFFHTIYSLFMYRLHFLFYVLSPEVWFVLLCGLAYSHLQSIKNSTFLHHV